MLKRTLSSLILQERQEYKKMIFVSGPRQAGKTTVFNQLRESVPGPMLNWDHFSTRKLLLKSADSVFSENRAIYLDEIHKMPRWKRFLKGQFDVHGENCLIHITGSARLDLYQKGGDSMLGRYIPFRLHPFSVSELGGKNYLDTAEDYGLRYKNMSKFLENINNDLDGAGLDAYKNLLITGPFPEPFMKGSKSYLHRWQKSRLDRLVYEDIRDATKIRELGLLQQLMLLLPDRAGSLLSLNSLKEAMEVSHESIRTWLGTLENFYHVFMLPPYSARIERSLKKERKLYFWDYSELEDGKLKEKNLVASHLLKWIHLMNDLGIGRFELCHYRDKEKNEIDFVITDNKKPVLLIDFKGDKDRLNSHLIKIHQKMKKETNIPCVQLVEESGVLKKIKNQHSDSIICSSNIFVKHLV